MDVRGEARLALVAVDARLGGDGVVVGQDDAALAAGHHLRRVEAERPRDAERAGHAITERRSVGMRSILEEEDPALVAQSAKLVDGGRHEAADVHDHEPDGLGSDGARHIARIDRHRGGVAIDELRPRAGGDDRGSRGEERVRRDEHVATVDRLSEGARDRNGISIALVPELTATACLAPWWAAKRSSSSRPIAPSVSCPDVRASSMRRSISARSSGGKWTCAGGTGRAGVAAPEGALGAVIVCFDSSLLERRDR